MRAGLFALFVVFAINAHSAIPRLIHVDANAPPRGNGTSARPYNKIADAVALARTMGGDPTSLPVSSENTRVSTRK